MPDDRPIYLPLMTPLDLREGGFDTAVLPVGATEYHGNHLPYCTDTLTAEALAFRFAEELRTAVVLPALSYGMSQHLIAFPWTMSVKPETLTAMVVDIAESLLAHGIDRLLVVSAHDGNPAPIEIAARQLADRRGMNIALFAGWQSMARRLLAGQYEIDLDHAGSSEMSMVLHLAPGLARPDQAIDLREQRDEMPLRIFSPFDRVVPHGHSGKPSRGTAEEGSAILDAIAAEVGPWLRNLAGNGWTGGEWLSGIKPPPPHLDPRNPPSREERFRNAQRR